MIGWTDIILRLGGAMLVGCAIGLNRELHHKATGMRTLGLVALGSALAVLAIADDPQGVGRVIQGVITGIGFLGAGVILHPPPREASSNHRVPKASDFRSTTHRSNKFQRKEARLL